MKNYKQTIENARFTVEDNGFSAAVISRLASMPPKGRVVAPIRISAWREFRLPMIGAAVVILFFGLIATRIIDFGSLADKYVNRTELFASKLSSINNNTLTPQVQTTDETDK